MGVGVGVNAGRASPSSSSTVSTTSTPLATWEYSLMKLPSGSCSGVILTNLGPTFLLKDIEPAPLVTVSPARSKDITPFLLDMNRALEIMIPRGSVEMIPV